MNGFLIRVTRLRFLSVTVCLLCVTATVALTACGTDMTNAREVYNELRSRYGSNDYEGMLDLLHRSSRQQLENVHEQGAEEALRSQLPPRSDLERMVNDVLEENPEAEESLEGGQRRELFYRILAARETVRRKRSGDLSPVESELNRLDLRYALALTIPGDELGRRMDPQRDSIEFNLGGAGTITFPIQRDTQNRVQFVWPRASR